MGCAEQKQMKTPDLSTVVTESDIKGEDPQETQQLQQLLAEAKMYLGSFRWCKSIQEAYCGMGVPGVIGVFLFRIEPAMKDVDEWLWVVVGDVPSAYITAHYATTATEALEVYIAEMTEWVKAAKEGRSVKELIPVNVEPTQENAAMLESRLKLLSQYLVEESE
jgi:hypothetical protein